MFFLDFFKLENSFRTNLINSISGPRVAYLVCTVNGEGIINSAVFNSIIHVGASPPLLGMIVRPDSVPRHTLENIRLNGEYTINSIHPEWLTKAHQTSARYPANISELYATGIDTETSEISTVPFIRESLIKIAIRLKEEIFIESNGTHFIIGEVTALNVPDEYIDEDGTVKVFDMDSILSVGLDTYGVGKFITRLPYAKP